MLKPKTKIEKLDDAEKDINSSQDTFLDSYDFDDRSEALMDGLSSKESAKSSQENGSLNSTQPASKTSPSSKSSLIKRSKVTERRKASTKRWVARKKALIAATGENASDSDSVNSDDEQLSPVQKARAKTNADKEAERQRRIAKALKHLATDMVAETITPADPESRRTRSRNTHSQSFDPPSKSEENLTPRSIRAELEIGDATYIVTSTLFFAEAQNGPAAKSHISKNASSKNQVASSEENVEENTDIFDAVQLRRINPKTPPAKESSYLERCLNIEVEGSELDALQRVQQELAIFVENEMKHKMSGVEPPGISRKGRSKDPAFSHLDTQLKSIVEKAIRKNYEASQSSDSAMQGGGRNVVSPAFMEAAMRSKIFQPKVVVQKMDIDEARKEYIINNLNVSQVAATEALPTALPLSRKRQITTPLKYQDYDVSDMLLGDREDREEVKKPARKVGPLSVAAKVVPPVIESEEKTPAKVAKIESKTEKHICAFCNKMFPNRMDIENHVKTHRIGNSVSATPTPAPTEKVRRMRCKRCHEIVEAKYVKMHKCQTPGTFKCSFCTSVFKTEKLLQTHAEVHKPKPNLKIEKENKALPRPKTLQNAAPAPKLEPQKVETKPNEKVTMCFLCDKKFTDEEMLKDHLQKHCDEMSGDDERLGKEDYQCAICCKNLETEEALEMHVQKHLYDEEDDNPNLISIDNVEAEKKVKKDIGYTCSECGENFASELLLVMHQPLHEEEAEIAEWEKRRDDSAEYVCELCDSMFSSELELAEHTYIHESAHVCLLCEQQFDSLKDLQKHVATH